MLCPNCQAEVVRESVFCHQCGMRLDNVAESDEADYPDAAPTATDTGPEPTPAERLKQQAGTTGHDDDETEEEVWQGGYCKKAMVGAWVAAILVTILGLAVAIWASLQLENHQSWVWLGVVLLILGLWGYQLVVYAYRRLSVRYRLTSQRLIHESGILRRRIDRVEVIDIDDVTCEQTVVERFVNVGTIRISSSDRTHPELLLAGIEDAKAVAGVIDDVRRKERRRRGLHIERI